MRRRRGLGCVGEDGASDTERYELGWYVRNCASSPAAAMLERIMFQRIKLLSDQGSDPEEEEEEPPRYASDRNRHKRQLRRVLEQFSELPPSDETLDPNAAFAREEFGLDEIDTGILILLLRIERNSNLEQFADEALRLLRTPSMTIAALLGISHQEARRRIAADGELVKSGLVHLDEDGGGIGLGGQCGHLQLAQPVRKVMRRCYRSRQEWVTAIVGQPLATPLAWEDFAHLGAARDLAARVIAGSTSARAKGVNLLLHGPVGTGKTEFAKALAAHTGMNIWSVGEVDGEGWEPSRGERLASLRLSLQLLARRNHALILFDEAEDVLACDISVLGMVSGQQRSGSKVFVNRMIEENRTPIVWTCNDVERMEPAILRRMMMAIEIKTPGSQVRERIWRQVLADSRLALGEDCMRRLADRYAVPPAVAASAARVAALCGGGEAEIEEAMSGVIRILGIAPCTANTGVRDFDPALVNCREDLASLVDRLALPGTSLQWSLCLHGAPGTGKSEFARYLASRLGMEVMQQRASDLLSKWVGDSEKRIAAAFEAARSRRALLVIDEADSLLSDRRDAARSWEVTQVNEMLTWMESHPLPFICSTNLMERLDQASLRRFTLKLRFAPLAPAQARLAFERFFGFASPRPLADGLTPGDFATVRRKRDLFGDAAPSTLADWLDDEAAAKGTGGKAIGFITGRN